jgi:TonB family protein
MMNLLIDSALRSTLILAIAWIITLALRRSSADLRHRIWLAALGGVALLPLIEWIAPSFLSSGRILENVPTLAAFAGAPAAAARSGAKVPWLAAIWMTGAALVLLRLAIGLMRIAKLSRAARFERDNIRVSDQVNTPLTWGVVRPVVLLPAYSAEWSDDQRETVLSHERAHIARHDWLWQIVTRLVAAVFWFHPLVWLAVGALRSEAERAADDRVLASGAAPTDYAERLLEVARRMSGPTLIGGVAMTRGSEVERRVREILDSSRRRSPARLWARVAIALGCLALLVPLAARPQRSEQQESSKKKAHKMGEEGVTSPKLTYKVEPSYTEEARDAKIQGTVAVQVVVNENGIAEDIVIVRSLDDGLDEMAKQAIAQWRFEPGTKDGEPVPVLAMIEINFKLK